METTNPVIKKLNSKLANKDVLGVLVVVLVILVIFLQRNDSLGKQSLEVAAMTNKEEVVPSNDVILPVVWGDLGRRMTESGVIDGDRFEALYDRRDGLSDYEKKLLYGANNSRLVINQKNAPVILNLLWALGLGNKNPILENGPMTDPRYGGAENFASTGGWTLSRGDSMQHYSRYNFVPLTPAQQALVEKVSKNIYRPCCNNSTYFPDCNHGMAMLGLLELMASQGVGEEEMYEVALRVNSLWFPGTYQTIAQFFAEQGISWSEVDPKIVLGEQYSSASGYRAVLALVESKDQGGVSCGV